MRLNRYLKEAKYDNEYIGKKVIYPMLIKDCKPFMIEFLKNQRKSGFRWFWRGTDKQITEIGKVTVRKNRKPKDTPQKTHELLDTMFFKKFGWKVRSEGVFTNPQPGTVMPYGQYAYAFFPIGKYRYVWSSRVEDLFSQMYRRNLTPDKADHLYSEIFDDDEGIIPTSKVKHLITMTKFQSWFKDPKGWFAEVLKRSDEIINTYQDDNMSMALAHRMEVSFNCKKYYLVEPQYLIHLERKLRGV
jgi:hypothetical protein